MEALSQPVSFLLAGIVGTFFFSLCFTALDLVTAKRAKRMAEDGKEAFAYFGEHPVRFWTALTIFEAMSVSCMFAGGYGLLMRFIAFPWLVWTILGVCFFVFEILLVRIIVRGRERAIAEKTFPMMKPFVTLCRPMATIIEKIYKTKQISDDINESANNAERIEEEIEIMLDASEKNGAINTLQGKILRSAIDFNETMVREVMVPRTELVGCPVTATFEEALRLCVEEGYSRMPIYGENLDDILGILYFKDLMLKFFEWEKSGKLEKNKSNKTVKLFARTPYFIPETNKINDVFKDFQKKHVHIAIVIDEFGGTAGIVTLEDLMEEFFGEIQDEYDSEPCEIQQLDKTKQHVIVDAKTSISEINDFFDKEFEEGGDFDSVGGFVSMKLGHVGLEGETVESDHLKFTVTKACERCILEVRIDVL